MTNYTAEQIKQLADEYADVYMFYGGRVTPDPRKSLHDAIDDLLREREVPEETISDELDAHRSAARELTNVLIGADALHITADGGTEAAWKNIIQSVKDLLQERESAPATEPRMLPGDLQVLANLGFKQTAERIAAELKRSRKSAPVVPDGLDTDTLKAISIDDRSWELFNSLKDAGAEYVEDDSGAWLTVTVEDIRLMFESLEAKP